MKVLDTKINQWIDDCSHFFMRDQEIWKALPWFCVISLLFYFSFLSFFPISIDSELASARVHSGVWISQGRWASFLIEKYLFGKTVLPFMPIALFCLAASISYVLVLVSHNLKIDYISYLSFPIFCAYPTWRLIGAFTANLPSLAWGLLACSIAAYLFKKICVDSLSVLSRPLLAGIFIQALLIATAVGSYQSYILLFVCFGLGIIIRTLFSDTNVSMKTISRMLGLLVLTSVVGLLIYGFIEALFLYTTGIKVSYIQNFYNPAQLIETPAEVLRATLSQASRVYSGRSILFGAPLTGIFIVMLMGIYSVLAASKRHMMLPGLALLILLAPFALTLISGERIPLRTLTAVPYVIWLFAVIALEHRSRAIQILTGIAISISLFQILYISSQQAAIKQITQQRDFTMAAQIYERIASVNPDFDSTKNYRVDFFGGKSMENLFYPIGKGSTAAGSFFGWDGGSTRRIVSFMRLIGYANLEVLQNDERLALIPHYHSMPKWPAEGSVKRVGDVTLIKLSDVAGKYDDY